MRTVSRLVLVLLWLVTCSRANLLWGFSTSNNFSILCGKSVGCDCARPEAIDCQNKALLELPDGILFPDKLDHATFSSNKLKSLTKNMFSGGQDLKQLDVSHNSVDFLSDDVFFELKGLESLDFSHNELWNLNLNVFVGLTNLKVINLSYNKISNFFSDVFKPCGMLREVDFRYNPMLYISSDSFLYMPSLEILNLESTGLSSLPSHAWTNNSNLKSLYLGSNAFKRIPTKALSSASNLGHIDISQNPIDILPKDAFKGLENLQTLTMNHMRHLRKIESGALRNLPSLRELYVSDNLQLTTISETAYSTYRSLLSDELYGKRSLQKVVMRHNGFKNLPAGLFRWDELVELDLSENPWDCNCYMSWIATQPLMESAKRKIICVTPPQYANKMILGMDKSDFVCRYLSPEAIIGLALLVALAFMLALGGAAFLLYRRRLCNCLFRRMDLHKYTRVVNTKDKVELEWDHGAEPLNASRSRTPSDA